MASQHDIDVVRAERIFYEACYASWLENGAQFTYGTTVSPAALAALARAYAETCVGEWRLHFAPARIGLPLTGEWDL